jgi:hypothetical protein
MTIKTTLNTALSVVLSNTWAVELPEQPIFPAIVFEIDTTPENTWALAGATAYEQHMVSIFIYAKTLTEIEALIPLVNSAVQSIPGYMYDGEHGDAPYENDPSIYAYFLNYVIRLAAY